MSTFKDELLSLGYKITDSYTSLTDIKNANYILYVQESSEYTEPNTKTLYKDLPWVRYAEKEIKDIPFLNIFCGGNFSNMRFWDIKNNKDLTKEYCFTMMSKNKIEHWSSLEPNERVFDDESIEN